MGRSIPPVPCVHVVTDDRVLMRPTFERDAKELLALGGGRIALHLRGPGATAATLHALATRLRGWALASGSTLVINDRADVAATAGVGSVHLGRRSLPPAAVRGLPGIQRVGSSVHSIEEVEDPAGGGSDWLFMGTIFRTPTHPDRSGCGLAALGAAARAAAGTPMLAIGGVRPRDVRDVLGVGAYGVAVIRGVWEEPDPGEALSDYLLALENVAEQGGSGR